MDSSEPHEIGVVTATTEGDTYEEASNSARVAYPLEDAADDTYDAHATNTRDRQRTPSVSQSTNDEDIGLERCDPDEETVATYNELMRHKGFIQNAERDIAMLQVTSRELEDFVSRASEYKDEYFDISTFASKVGRVWQDRRPPSRATTTASNSRAGTQSAVAAALAGRPDSGSVATSRRLIGSASNSVDATAAAHDAFTTTTQSSSPSKVRIARIFPNESAILAVSQEQQQAHAERLRAADAQYNHEHNIMVRRNEAEAARGLIEQRQPGMMRRVAKNEERRRVFDEAMKARAEQIHADRLVQASLVNGGLTTDHTSRGIVADASGRSGGYGSPTRPTVGSAVSYRSNINTTAVLQTTAVSLPPLSASMTGALRTAQLPAHLQNSADGSKVLGPRRRPDAMGALNLTNAAASSTSGDSLAGLNRTAGNATIVTSASVAISPSRARPFASDLVEPALSSFTPEAYYGGVSTHPAHLRRPEVDKAAKLLQQQARERKLAADKAKYGEDAAADADPYGPKNDGAVGSSPSQRGSVARGAAPSSAASSLKTVQPSSASPSYTNELEKLLSEQEEGLSEQARRHAEEYTPMLEKYFEYHDLAQRKLDRIAALAGMDASEKGMCIPPKPATDDRAE